MLTRRGPAALPAPRLLTQSARRAVTAPAAGTAAATEPAGPTGRLPHRIRRGLPHDRRGALRDANLRSPARSFKTSTAESRCRSPSGRALQTFAQIELEAGRELVGFAAEYVELPAQFPRESGDTAHRRAVSYTLLAGLTPVPAARRPSHPADRRPCSTTRQSTSQRADRSDNSHDDRAVRRRDDSARRRSADQHLVEGRHHHGTTEEVQINCRWNLSRLPAQQLRPTTRTPTPLRQTKPMSTRRRQRRTAGARCDPQAGRRCGFNDLIDHRWCRTSRRGKQA